MIHLVLPPADRPPSCPFVQRTRALQVMLDKLGERFETHGIDNTVATEKDDLVFFSWPKPRAVRPTGALAVECGVGYDLKPWGPLRVYETEAWRHYCFGKYNVPLYERQASWVIPWAHDPGEWSLGDGRDDYVAYLGRLTPDKGIGRIVQVARALPRLKFLVASEDHRCGLDMHEPPANVEFVGPVAVGDRVDFLGRARCLIAPTEYVEPLGGSPIEAMLCGTPAIGSSFGGFTESIVEGLSGFRCATTSQFAGAIEHAGELDRAVVRAVTESRFGINTVSALWKRALVHMRSLL